MATLAYSPNCAPSPKASAPQVAPQPKLHPLFSQSTHTFLQVYDAPPGSPPPDNITVEVFDASKNIKINLDLKITDTTDTLIKKYLQKRPELVGHLHLAFNGKPVPEKNCLRELGVKSGAVFITFQKCVGG